MKDLTIEEISNIKYLYHATPYSNLGQILSQGITPYGEGIYLADSYQNAAKFLLLRSSKVLVFKIKASKLDKKQLQESFDHSYNFFQCRAYIYTSGIIPTNILDLNSVRVFGS